MAYISLTKGALCKILEDEAKLYRKTCKESLIRNMHMHECYKKNINQADPALIDAILVDFINHITAQQGVDLGLYTKDLKNER